MKKVSLVVLLLVFSIVVFAGEREDVNNLNELYNGKKYNDAITASKAFLKKYPTSEKAFSIEQRLAKTYYVRKDYNNAIKSFQTILGKYMLKPEEVNEYNYYIAKSYLLLEDEVSASKIINKIDKTSVYYERSFYDSGIIYLDRDDYEKAFKTFKKIAVSGTTFKNASLFNMALTAYNDGKYELVIEVLNSYVPLKDKNRDDSAILYLYGTSYYKLDKTDQAIKYFEELADSYPRTPYGKKSKIVLIEIYANKKNNQKVVEYADSLKGTTEESEAFVTLGDYYVSIENFDKAIEYYKGANVETNPRALYGYAYSLYRKDRVQEALPYFKKLEKSSYYNQAIYYKFACYYKLKQYKTIVENKDEAKKIVVTQQDNDNINIVIANAAYELKMAPLAREYYSKLNLHTPSKDNLYRVITMSGELNRANDVEKRVADYKKLYPGDKEYRKKIYVAAGEALYNNGLAEPAERLYKEYLETDNDKDILDALTALLVNEKKYSEMGKYLDKQGDSVETKYLRAVSATGIGRYEEAEKYYLEVLKNINSSPSSPWYLKTKMNQLNNYFLWGKYDLVIARGQEYIQIPEAKDKEDIIEKIAISYYRTDKYDASREYFSKLLSNKDKVDSTNFQIADSYFAEENYPRAKEIYQNIYNSSSDEKSKEVALYSLSKVAAKSNNLNEFKKISADFIQKYPNSEYKENIMTSYSQVASGIKNSSEIIKTYKTIYANSKEEYVKQNALEKISEAYLDSKNYVEAEKNGKLITEPLKKAYILAQVYEKTKKTDSAAKQYEVLVKSPEYKEYAAMNLAKYWYAKNSLAKSREYYSMIFEMPSSSYKDVALFQIAQIDEKLGKKDLALKNYKRLYTEFSKSQYKDEAKMKAAQITEIKSQNEALKIYMDIAKTSKEASYKTFALEKIIYSSLKAKKMDIAKKYYNELKKVDSSAAQKYDQFFQGGA